MLDVRFFKNARFSAASATITLTFFGFYASTFLLTQYFQFILGYSPLKAGVIIIPTAVGLMIGSPIAPVWSAGSAPSGWSSSAWRWSRRPWAATGPNTICPTSGSACSSG